MILVLWYTEEISASAADVTTLCMMRASQCAGPLSGVLCGEEDPRKRNPPERLRERGEVRYEAS